MTEPSIPYRAWMDPDFDRKWGGFFDDGNASATDEKGSSVSRRSTDVPEQLPAPRKPRGFAAMSPERRAEYGRRGGSVETAKGFAANRALAKSAGSAGGRARAGRA